MTTLPEFIKKHNITMEAERVPFRTNSHVSISGAKHWKFALHFKDRVFDGEFSAGSGISDIDLASVLSCLVVDATFYDSEPEDDEDLVKECKLTKRKLRKFLGYYLFNKLVYEVEPY